MNELKKEWDAVFYVYPRDSKNPSHGRKTTRVNVDWKGITRTECLRKLFRVYKKTLRNSSVKNPRLLSEMILGRKAKKGPYRTVIRLKLRFRKLEDFEKVRDPLECFIIGYGPKIRDWWFRS